jgi:hypothetical protein
MKSEALREVPGRTPDAQSEARLLEIRREAERHGQVRDAGIRPPGAPFPQASPETGYYGIHMLKEPQWKPTIPLYFFVGGAAGSAAVIGAVCDWLGKDPDLAQDARWLAMGGALVSTGLLIEDLGRPDRFLNMLRMIKVQSPMSMGAWTLAAFGGFSTAAAFAKAAERRFGHVFPIAIVGGISQFFSAMFGLPFHNYTGVLIGATAIPVWNHNIETLPIHFGMSGVQAGVSILELMGHSDSRALNLIGIVSTLFECWEGFHLESRREAALRPLKRGTSGWITRTGGMLSGPIPLGLRLLGGKSKTMRKWAAVSGILGSLLTRYGWMQAGKSSAQDWRLPLEIPEHAAVIKEMQSKPELPQVRMA